MNDPREEVEMQLCLTGRTLRSRVAWAGRLVRTEIERAGDKDEQ